MTNLISDNLAGLVNLSDNDDTQIINYHDTKYSRYVPQCRRTITYIVGIVLLNKNNQVCLIQEAKESCKDKWYLPAGRMEPCETLVEAVIRECKEECGYLVEPFSLSSVEIDSFGYWHRFTFLARIVGGKLKTSQFADAESLQAEWFDLDEIKKKSFARQLRSKDVIQLIDIAAKYYHKYKIDSLTSLVESEFSELRKRFNFTVPTENPHGLIKYTFVAVYKNTKCLVYMRSKSKRAAESGVKSLPSVIYYPNIRSGRAESSIDYAIKSILFANCFKEPSKFGFSCNGILAIDHYGHPKNNVNAKDGMRFIFLVDLFELNAASGEESNDDDELTPDFSWFLLENDQAAAELLKDYQNEPDRFVTLINSP